MSNLFKKTLSVLIALILVIGSIAAGSEGAFDIASLLSINASAEIDGIFTYKIENNQVTITSCDKSVSGELEIPLTIAGYPVTRIGERAFRDCSNLTDVIISDNITSIEDYAFENCNNIRSLTVGENVSRIGKSFFSEKKITNVYIPENVTFIDCDKGVFSFCEHIETVTVSEKNSVYYSADNCILKKKNNKLIAGCVSSTIPTDSKVTEIGDYAFYEAYALYLTIPENITKIGDYAFYDCIGDDIVIPPNVSYIGENAFGYFGGLIGTNLVVIPDSVTGISSTAFNTTGYFRNNENWDNGTVLYIGNHLIAAKPNISGEYSIKEGTVSVSSTAFKKCSDLEKISIPGSVKTIGKSAFEECKALSEVYISEGVEKIDDSAFYRCESLRSISLPESVTEIGNGAFSKCTNLASIGLGHQITELGFSFDDTFFYNDESNWEDGILYIGEYLISGEKAEGECHIKDGTRVIAAGAFSGANNMFTISIPNTVELIGEEAFFYCTLSGEVIIPESVKAIGTMAFAWSPFIEKYIVSSSNPYYCSDYGFALFNKSKTELIAYPPFSPVRLYAIPSSVKKIKELAFLKTEHTEKLIIPSSFTSSGGLDGIVEPFIGSPGKLKAIYYRGSKEQFNESYTTTLPSYLYTGLENLIHFDYYGPVGLISSSNEVATSQTVTLEFYDDTIIDGYYWGTSENYSENNYYKGSSLNVVKAITEEGSYYLTVKNKNGLLSDTEQITFYKTTLDPNGGTVSPPYVLTKSGNSFALPVPTKENTGFVWWSRSKNDNSFTTSIIESETYAPTKSRTLYAFYEDSVINEGYITSTNNCASEQTATLHFNMESDTVIGYYWGKNEGYDSYFTSPFFEKNDMADEEYVITEEGTYYFGIKYLPGGDYPDPVPEWCYAYSDELTITYYKTTLDANGGSVSTDSILTPEAQQAVLPVPVREGYTFVKWSENPDGTGESFSAGESIIPEANTTLYAQWAQTNPVSIEVNSMPSKTTYYVGDSFDVTGLTLTATYEDTSKKTVTSGFDWNPKRLDTEGNQIVTVTFGGQSITFTVTVLPVPASNHTIRFMVDNNEYSKASYKEGDSIQIPTNPTKAGYTFIEWDGIPAAMPSDDITVNAVFEAIKYNAVFIADGITIGVVPYTIESSNVTEPAVPEKNGFIGKWSEYSLDIGGVTINAVYTKTVHNHNDSNNDGKCDDCGEITDRTKYENYVVSNATVNVGQSKTVDYRAKVTVVATASNIPEGFYLAIFDGNNLCAKGDNETVTYFAGEMKADRLFTVKIVDADGNPKGNNFQKNVKVSVNTSLFAKIIAFFKGLFGMLPNVEIKP